jgi:hypothetical protein
MLAIATGYERLAMRDEERQTAAKKIPLRRTRYTHDLNGTDLRGGLASSVGGGPADCPSNIRPIYELVVNLKTAKALDIELPTISSYSPTR